MNYLFKSMIIMGLIISSVQAKAQVKVGVKAGLNLNNIAQNLADSDFEIETEIRPAYHLGILLDFELSDHFGLQSGLLYQSKGFNYDVEDIWGEGTDGYDRMILNYLEIPIHAVYKIENFQIYAGPYLAVGVGGKNKWDVEDADFGFEDQGEIKMKPIFGKTGPDVLDEDESGYSAFDIGLNFGIGYQAGPVLMNIGYSLGLGNLVPNYDIPDFDRKDRRITNRVISVSATYLFGS